MLSMFWSVENIRVVVQVNNGWFGVIVVYHPKPPLHLLGECPLNSYSAESAS